MTPDICFSWYLSMYVMYVKILVHIHDHIQQFLVHICDHMQQFYGNCQNLYWIATQY